MSEYVMKTANSPKPILLPNRLFIVRWQILKASDSRTAA
ncbi:hypothetical protein ECDEC10C_4808 [Escherichia coli DEC10C]|nr:hypothetical protein ECDEC10C_4808 [Escherichia coli DEC10C]